jgi:CheY-like chemotaxis protein
MPVDPPWRILCIDDDVEITRQLEEALPGEEVDDIGSRPEVVPANVFEDALDELERTRYDALILDVRLGRGEGAGDQAGIRTLTEIQARRFVPVIFYTAIPSEVEHLRSAFVRVVEKTAGIPRLLEELRYILGTNLPLTNRLLLRHVEEVQRAYMWEFVAEHWDRFGDSGDRGGLAYLLARRLALSLGGPAVEDLASKLGATAPGGEPGDVAPMRYYVLPPVEATPLAGDIFEGPVGDTRDHYVLLTPSCDLANEPVKADYVVLARCVPLEVQAEYQAWRSDLPDENAKQASELARLLRNSRSKGQPDRWFFLPAALTVPNLLVDFQQITTLPCTDLTTLSRVASLDSPFAEALVARFNRYFGRLGTPNLNPVAVMSRIAAEVAAEEGDGAE